MKHVTKYLILTILAVVMMSSVATAFAAQNGPEGHGGRFGRGVVSLETAGISDPRQRSLSDQIRLKYSPNQVRNRPSDP